jgi:mitogen-activated protein kinase 1/3
LREIKLMIHFNGHPNIINILDLIPPRSFDDFNDIYIVMDCMDQDLANVLKERNPYDESITKRLFYQILLGLFTIHDSFVLHRDLKPSNILIDSEMQCRICDFGLSRGMDTKIDPHMSTLYVVTRYYRSPELCCEYDKSYKPLDMWSIGCVFAEMLQKPTRKPLFPGDSTLKQLKLILDICGKQEEEDVKGVENAKLFVQQTGKKEKVVWEKYPKFRHVKNEGLLIGMFTCLDGNCTSVYSNL